MYNITNILFYYHAVYKGVDSVACIWWYW